MAALYKRYIPSKSATEPLSTVSPASGAVSVISIAKPETPERKRKRDRTEEEIVERKAKKLQKKGLDTQKAFEQASSVTGTVEPSNGVVQGTQVKAGQETVPPQSEFADVTSKKKRRKLEAEARKARKATKKDSRVESTPNVSRTTGVTNNNSADDDPLSVSNFDVSSKETLVTASPNQTTHHAKAVSPVGGTKRKKRRKDGDDQQETHSTGTLAASPGPEATSQLVDTAEDTQDTTTSSQPQRRRHKLEKVFDEHSKEADDEEDEANRLKKFSGILEKFQKSTQRSQRLDLQEKPPQTEDPVDESKIVRDLILPLPERTATPEFRANESSLPAWLARPTVISADSKKSFAALGLQAATVDFLSKLGFVDALPVQQAVLPVLLPPGVHGSKFLPGTEEVVPDLTVGAATGSGKTIAYLLPILEGLKRCPSSGRLRALIVVPTKELVQQVAAVAESLSKGSGIRIGMSTASGRFRNEQRKFVHRSERYDPEGYAALMSRVKRRTQVIDESSSDFETLIADLTTEDAKLEQRLQDAVRGTLHHVPTYESSVDILVATPGRLLEHLNSTLGFNLVHLQWLVIDEVDKLLDNQFEGFLESVNTEIMRARASEEQDEREKFLRTTGIWDDKKERRVRKAVFSATMTRDVSKLMSLQLRRPQMIIVRGSDPSSDTIAAEGRLVRDDATNGVREIDGAFELPRSLLEYCVPVGDGRDKPLIALELLESRILSGSNPIQSRKNTTDTDTETSSDENSDSSSDSESSSLSDSDDTSGISSSESSSLSESSDTSDDETDEMADKPAENRDLAESSLSFVHPDRLVALRSTAQTPTVLIFTSSNESASRLSHLLKNLRPAWASWVTVLTKVHSNKGPRFQSKADEPSIVVSTDRAARGLDNFNGRPITHVIQYDIPRSLTSYVHRVGRTARAGRKGDAWTLFTNPEGRWFDNEILKSKNVKRAGAVERVKLFVSDDGLREKFGEVLGSMREEVSKS